VDGQAATWSGSGWRTDVTVKPPAISDGQILKGPAVQRRQAEAARLA
jgi:hypothetical protein